MQLEIGKIYSGKVKGITPYGAFIDIEGGGTGMVHISEIANAFVSDIREHLTENQEVRVKVIGINDAGKVSLSIKRVTEGDAPPRPRRQQNQRSKPNVWEPKKVTPPSEMTFEDMMSHFKQTSEERMCDLKRSNDRKNGTRRK